MTREEAIDRVLDVTWPRWREWQPAAKGGWLLQLRQKRAERIVDALLGQPDPEVEAGLTGDEWESLGAEIGLTKRVERAEEAIRAALRSDLALTNEPREALACRDSVMNALRAVLSEQEGETT